MDKNITKKYTNGEITIEWQPSVCIHSKICWKGSAGLIDVFNPAEKPWIKPDGASSQRIIEQINKCPSGALSYYINNESEQNNISESQNSCNISYVHFQNK